MRPLTVITGILLGSCLAITVSLAAVLLVFFILADDYPRVQHELKPLVSSISIFFGMTIISAASFYTLLINHRVRHLCQGLLWAGVVATSWYYIP
jgi:hypothetical protein